MYKVLSGDSPVDLALAVERYITLGWRLQGGIAVVRWDAEVGACWEFYQAMAKDEAPPLKIGFPLEAFNVHT